MEQNTNAESSTPLIPPLLVEDVTVVERVVPVSRGKYSSVEEMVLDLTDKEFAEEFSKRIRQKRANQVVFEGVIDYSSEDWGQALISAPLNSSSHPEELFMRLQSWNQDGKHTSAECLRGKLVRVTLNVIEENHAEAESGQRPGDGSQG